MSQDLARVQGSREAPLWIKTLGSVVDEQASRFGSHPAAIFPWQSVKLSYADMAARSKILAKSMLEMGLQHGDCVGVFAGNCYQYIEVFLGGSRIGCPVVVLNNTYTPAELRNSIDKSSCKLVFMATSIGSRNLSSHIDIVRGTGGGNSSIPSLRRIISLGPFTKGPGVEVQSYSSFVANGRSFSTDDLILERAEKRVVPSDVLNLQFTSGTTGSPKAAMLTHINLLNNGRFVGSAMDLTNEDVICCPPPLFHCFGLVLGFLSSFCHGSTIVFPADFFDVRKVVNSIVEENATVLLGVPTMFISELEELAKTKKRPRRLRTGLASGSAVSQDLMNELRDKMGVEKMLIAYGMTETSPVSFITSLNDSDEKRTSTVGRIIPHAAAKVIGKNGQVLKKGERGELCTSGFILQTGYWNNPEKTKEVMRYDEDGILWMHTGDEAVIDKDGYGCITGRIKDIIIRGGENIFPREIEERITSHPSISEASVVGIKDDRYGEVVGCFLKPVNGSSKLSHHDIKIWVSEKLGRHKEPRHVFWLGDPGVGDDFPKTGSGKHQKHILRDIGNNLVRNTIPKAKL